MRKVRLAVLLCDDIITRAVRGDYARLFREFLSSSLALITSDVTFTLDAYDVVYEMAYPPDDVHYDGILISGSRLASVEDPIPWVVKLVEYVQRTLVEKPSLKMFGICFGHQVIAKALGSRIEEGEWEVSVTTVYLTRIGRTLFDAHRLHLQLFHQREVTKVPPRAHLLGLSEDVGNQGFVMFHDGEAPLPADLESDADALRVRLTSVHVLTLQGHPELTEPVMRMLIAKSVDELPKDLVDDALARVGLPTDAIDKVGRVMWGVLGVTADR